MSEHNTQIELKQDEMLQKKLAQLLEYGKTKKKIPSKMLIDTLDALDANEQQTDYLYDALEAAGIEIDVEDVLDLIGKTEELEPSETDLKQEEEAQLVEEEALEEATRVIEGLQGFSVVYPVVFDMEYNFHGKNPPLYFLIFHII